MPIVPILGTIKPLIAVKFSPCEYKSYNMQKNVVCLISFLQLVLQ